MPRDKAFAVLAALVLTAAGLQQVLFIPSASPSTSVRAMTLA